MKKLVLLLVKYKKVTIILIFAIWQKVSWIKYYTYSYSNHNVIEYGIYTWWCPEYSIEIGIEIW